MVCDMCKRVCKDLDRYLLPMIHRTEMETEGGRKVAAASEVVDRQVMICWRCAKQIAEKIGEMKND